MSKILRIFAPILKLVNMMSLREAITICLKQKYSTISGRASRAEYWWFTLFMYLVYIVIYTLSAVMMFNLHRVSGAQMFGALLVIGLMSIISILLVVPSICVGIRRLHDIGRSGWWILLSFAPIVRWVIFVFSILPSQPTANEYGDNPHEQESISYENEKCSEYMKKTTFQGILALYSGFVGAVLINGILFRTLHWPGGTSMLCGLVPILVALLCLCFAIYVFKHGALNAYVEKGLSVAKHLRNVEGTAFIFLALAILGFVCRHLHWHGGSQVVMVSCFALMWLSILSGVLACIFLTKKQ